MGYNGSAPERREKYLYNDDKHNAKKGMEQKHDNSDKIYSNFKRAIKLFTRVRALAYTYLSFASRVKLFRFTKFELLGDDTVHFISLYAQHTNIYVQRGKREIEAELATVVRENETSTLQVVVYDRGD